MVEYFGEFGLRFRNAVGIGQIGLSENGLPIPAILILRS